MKQHIIMTDDVAPGIITLDDLVLDPAVPLSEQLEDLKDDLLQVDFPNGCVIDVSYVPEFDPGGSFVVALSQRGPDIERRDCASLDELRHVVVELARVAAQRAWIPHGMFRPQDVHPGYIGTNLVLDPDRPLAEQADRLGRNVFSLMFSDYVMMTVDWLPEHAPDGSFHVTVKRWEHADPPDPTVHFQRTCQTVAELREAVNEVVRARAAVEG